MSEEKKEPWLNYLALTTVVLAVCATMATFKGGGYSSRSLLSQTQASDQWAYFQSKSIKGYLNEMQRDQLELQLGGSAGNTPQSARYRDKIEAYNKKVAKYEAEKKKIEQDAKMLEQARDDAMKHGQAFGVAVIFLQIAILLSSVSALLKKRWLWLIGTAVGCYGIVAFANGFFLFM